MIGGSRLIFSLLPHLLYFFPTANRGRDEADRSGDDRWRYRPSFAMLQLPAS